MEKIPLKTCTQIVRDVCYTGIGSENRHLIHFLPYSYVWINVKKEEME